MAPTFTLPHLPSLSRSRHSDRDVVGLDIEPGFVTAVRARVNGSVRVHHAAGIPLDLDVVREGEVLDVGALTEALRELFRDSRLQRSVRIGLANQRTVLRTLDLPPISDRKELAAAVRFQAADQVPMPLANAVLDFHSLGIVATPDGPRQRVVLVAAQRDMVERLLDATRAAGLRPVGVDLAAFAMIRSLFRREGTADERLVYLAVGGLTNMAIADGRICRFTRVLGGGLEAMAVDVAARREIPLIQARSLLNAVGLPAPSTAGESRPPVRRDREVRRPVAPERAPDEGSDDEPLPRFSDEPDRDVTPATPHAYDDDGAAEAGSRGAEDPDADVRTVLANGVREIAGEMRNSLDFQRAQHGGTDVSAIVLSGPALEVPGFARALENELGLPVRPGVVDADHEGAFGLMAAERLSVAAGLSVEEGPGA